MAKKSLPRPKVGDIVTWRYPAAQSTYTPGPYKLVSIRGTSVFLECLDGRKVYFGTPRTMEHQGVDITQIRVDPFLNAARKANLEVSDGKT